LTPLLIFFHLIFPHFQEVMVSSVIYFSVIALPLSLVLSFISGIVDGITRFKTLRTPLLKSKMIYGIAILVFSFTQLIIFTPDTYTWITIVLSLVSLASAVKLGLLGKHLIDVILPGTYVRRKKKPTKYAPKGRVDNSAITAKPVKKPEVKPKVEDKVDKTEKDE